MTNFFSLSGGGAVVVRFICLCWLLAGGHPAWSQVISSFAPASGPIDTSVIITGSGFNATAGQNVVFFGATRAAVTAASPSSLTVTVPLGATYQDFTVTNLATGLTAYSGKPFDVTLVGAATFRPKVDAATGTTPLTVATGDVTDDGKADVVVVNYDDNTVSVLRNTSTPGAVSFAPKVDYSTGQLPIAVAVGDLDGDGRPDLAVTNAGSVFVSVLRNTSTAGAVSFAPSLNVGIGTRAGSLAIGDVDGDGKPDLIVADFGNSLMLVLRNTSTPGAVSFAPPAFFASGIDSYGAYAVAVGDVDGDGRPDLAVTNYSVNTVSVFRNTSTPGAVSFAAKVDLGYGTDPYSVVLGDLDGDGLPDLTMTSNTSVAVFRNTSTPGTVSFAAGVDFTTGQRPYAVRMGDVDGDGLPDLAAAIWGVNAVWVLRNTSVPGTISLVAQAVVLTGTRPRSVAIGDLDGDGKPDLVTANELGNTVSVLRQTVRLRSLALSAGTLSPAFDSDNLTYTAIVSNATSSLQVAPDIDNPAASALVNGTAVVSGSYSGAIALAVGNNTITVVLDGLTYTVTVTRLAALTLGSFAPASGPAGTSVTITGTSLDLVTGVRFGTGTLTTNFVAQSATSLTVLVPVVASTGAITLTTGMADGASSATAFTYTPRPAGLVAALAPAGPLSGCQARTLTASASSPAFATGTGFNDDVRSVVVQADGKVLVGGSFTSYNGTLGNRLVRLNPDGSRDATFATGSGFNNTVFSVAVQADGKVLVGGAFGVYNGAPASFLVRLNPNGSRDVTFATGSGFDGGVASVVVQADGKILVGGAFTTYNGAPGQSHLVRLNANGSRDATFNAGGGGFDNGVYTVAVLADGKVLAGGFFTSYNSATGNYLVRLNADGSRDGSFTIGSGFTGGVLSVAVQADDQMVVGGSFTTYNGAPANYLVRLNAGGYADAAFNAGGAGFDSSVFSVAMQADGQVLVGGNFASYNGTPANYLVRLDADGTRDAGFNAAGAGFDNPVLGVAVQPDGKVLAGGVFTGYNGAPGQNRLLRLNPDGSANTAPTAVSGAGFTFSPGGTTTNPLVTSAAGSYTAVASLNGETSAASNAVVITACPAPTLISLSPTSGPVGTSVTITGTGLTGATSVSFNGTTQPVITNNTSTNLTVVVPTGTTTGSVTVTTPSGTSNGVTFTVTYPDLVISTGTAAAPVAVAAGIYNSITVTGTGFATLGGAVVVNSAVSISGSLDTNCQALTGAGSFTLAAGATLRICDVNGISPSGTSGAVRTTGVRSFSTDASYVYNATQAQSTGTGLPATVRNLTQAASGTLFLTLPVAIRQVLALPTASNFNLNNHALTLLSDASGTALVANLGGGQVLGNTATLQRHIETNTASGGYRHYASPMVATAGAETLATLATAGYAPDFSGAAAYNTSATPGLVTPFPTVFLYNQDRIATTTSTYDAFDKGWQAALGSEVPQVGRGYAVQAPGAARVDFTGQLTSGSVSRSNLAWTGADGGWHLLGNPFPSPLDWSTMTLGAGQNLENMGGALYVFQSSGPYTGQYRTYLASAPGAGSPLIPAGAGFFVRTATPGGAGTVRFTSANRVTTFGAQPAFGRSNDVRPVVTLALQGAGGPADALILYADPAATTAVDAAYDAPKLANPSGLNLASHAAPGTTLSIDGRPALAGRIPLQVSVPATGTYTLTATLANLPATTAVTLTDALTGQTIDLRQQPAYTGTVVATNPAVGRFFLNLTPAAAPLATGTGMEKAFSLYPNPARGAAAVTGLMAGAPVTLLDALGRVVVLTSANASGTACLVLPAGLAAGMYVVRSGTQAQRLMVE